MLIKLSALTKHVKIVLEPNMFSTPFFS